MGPLELVRLTPLMDRSRGNPDVTIGLIDGPVVTDHPDLTGGRIREMRGSGGATCNQASSTACRHGTFVTGILSARRDASAPAICPDCTLLVRPIFSESLSGSEQMPAVTPRELAAAITDWVITSLICEAVADGNSDHNSAVAPVTKGTATLVPPRVSEGPSAPRLMMRSPGALKPRLPIEPPRFDWLIGRP